MDEAQPRTRTIEWHDPAPYVEQAAAMSGLDYLRALADGRFPRSPIAVLMNFTGIEVEEGRVVFRAEPAEFHLNPVGLVHGGLAATLLDSAMGCAIHTTLPAGAFYTTAQLNVHYVRAPRVGGGEIVCEGRVLHAGRSTATADATIRDAAGKLVAHGTTTCIVFRPPQDAGGTAERP
jgi:uncharacterized protein (TIGR00369 family)